MPVDFYCFLSKQYFPYKSIFYCFSSIIKAKKQLTSTNQKILAENQELRSTVVDEQHIICGLHQAIQKRNRYISKLQAELGGRSARWDVVNDVSMERRRLSL